MSEIRDRLQAQCERANARGQKSTFFFVEDIEHLLGENADLERDNVDLIGRCEEAADALHV